MFCIRKSGLIALAIVTAALALTTAPGNGFAAATGALAQTVHVDPLPAGAADGGGQPRWMGNTVTWLYSPAGSPAGITADQAVGALQAAMDRWSAGCNVAFVHGGVTVAAAALPGQAVVSWDPDIAPAAAQTRLAHAALAIDRADIVLDPVSVGSADTLARVAMHQVGHALGLPHADVAGQAMSGPPAADYTGQAELGAGDAAACAAVYGPAPGSPGLHAAAAPVPTCTATPSSATPPLGGMVVITPSCTGAPTSYAWTGCQQVGTSCLASSAVPGPKTFTLVAGNAYGPGAATGVTVTWQGGGTPVPTCSVSISNTRPAVGQTVTFAAACTNSPARHAWTNCSSTTGTCATTSATPGVRTYAVAAANAGGTGAAVGFSVDWQAGAPAAAAVPVCTLSAGSLTPAVNALVAIAATCSGAPSSYAWTGCRFATGSTCYATAAAGGPVTYTLRATNAGGAGAAAITLDWKAGSSATAAAPAAVPAPAPAASPAPAPVPATPAAVTTGWKPAVAGSCNGWPSFDMGRLPFDGSRAFSQDFDAGMKGGFGNRSVAVATLRVPEGAVAGTRSNVAVYEYAGPQAWRRVWLSRTRCDLSATAPAYASESGPHIYLSVGVPRAGAVTVQPGETWYLMVANQIALFGNIRDSCSATGYCEIGVTAYPFN